MLAQDDLLYESLTVYETLCFAAMLRLPSSMTRAQKVARVADVIQSLGLGRCKDTIIGAPSIVSQATSHALVALHHVDLWLQLKVASVCMDSQGLCLQVALTGGECLAEKCAPLSCNRGRQCVLLILRVIIMLQHPAWTEPLTACSCTAQAGVGGTRAAHQPVRHSTGWCATP